MNRMGITSFGRASVLMGMILAGFAQQSAHAGNAYLNGKGTAEPHSHGGLGIDGDIFEYGSWQMDEGAIFTFYMTPDPDPVTGIVPTGTMTLEPGSVLSYDLGPDPGYMVITGNLILGGALELDVLPGGPVGVPREIIEYSGMLTGQFTSVTPGFTVDESEPGEIFVTAAPEPGYLGIGVVLGLGRRKRLNHE
jgi:hypothetical protein